MKVVHSMEEIPKLEEPIALSIGVFDGVHLGHQMIFKRLNKLTRKGGTSVILTFSNHPSTHLTPNSPVPLLTSLDHRLKLLKKQPIDLAIVLPFNEEIANQSYSSFFGNLRTHLPFKHLIVGEDARFGKGRSGGPDQIKALGWDTEYLSKETLHKEEISSGLIRHYLEERNLKKVKKMLGRPYSISLPFGPLDVIRENEVQYKWVTGTKKLCLLPSAVYAVDLHINDQTIPAIAFYRGTQNISGETEVSLTLYFEKEIKEGEEMEIVFISYLHDELDPDFGLSSKANLLETLKPEFFPS
ncbi:MAG: hypothetical protein KDK76_02105 [Chlamydiia bacterium]|nr:hypothetical protein [Chlamydiia bacterium]